jgi:hypothetical protein
VASTSGSLRTRETARRARQVTPALVGDAAAGPPSRTGAGRPREEPSERRREYRVQAEAQLQPAAKLQRPRRLGLMVGRRAPGTDRDSEARPAHLEALVATRPGSAAGRVQPRGPRVRGPASHCRDCERERRNVRKFKKRSTRSRTISGKMGVAGLVTRTAIRDFNPVGEGGTADRVGA